MSSFNEYVDFNITVQDSFGARSNLTLSAAVSSGIVLDMEWSESLPFCDAAEELISYHLLECSTVRPGDVLQLVEYLDAYDIESATWRDMFENDDYHADDTASRVLSVTVETIAIHEDAHEVA